MRWLDSQAAHAMVAMINGGDRNSKAYPHARLHYQYRAFMHPQRNDIMTNKVQSKGRVKEKCGDGTRCLQAAFERAAVSYVCRLEC